MSRPILERVAQGQEVTKDECLRSLAAHMANLKSLMDRLEKDNELFTKTPTEFGVCYTFNHQYINETLTVSKSGINYYQFNSNSNS